MGRSNAFYAIQLPIEFFSCIFAIRSRRPFKKFQGRIEMGIDKEKKPWYSMLNKRKKEKNHEQTIRGHLSF